MSGTLTFGGVAASTHGLKIGSVNVYNAPSPRQEVFHVPGRIGDVVPVDSPENWPNEIREYAAALYMRNASMTNVAKRFAEIRDWLMKKGYQTLTDSYEPAFYRRAYLSGDFVPQRAGAGQNFKASLVFSCDPRRFLANISDIVLFSAGGSTTVAAAPTAPTIYPVYSKTYPLLTIQGGGEAFDLNFDDGNETYGYIKFASTTATFTFDCETLECSASGIVTDVSGDLYMVSGGTIFERTKTSPKITLTPRWFVR